MRETVALELSFVNSNLQLLKEQLAELNSRSLWARLSVSVGSLIMSNKQLIDPPDARQPREKTL